MGNIYFRKEAEVMEPGVSNWKWISWSNGVRKCCKREDTGE